VTTSVRLTPQMHAGFVAGRYAQAYGLTRVLFYSIKCKVPPSSVVKCLWEVFVGVWGVVLIV